jgi:hypothetical protein
MAVSRRVRSQPRAEQRDSSRRVHWGWIGLSALPIGALITDRDLPAPWVVGLSIAAGILLLLGFSMPQKVWKRINRGIAADLDRQWDENQRGMAVELLDEATTSLDELIDAHAPSRNSKSRAFGSQRHRRQALLDDYEPLRAEVELAISTAMRAGARDDGTMLLAKKPRDLTGLIALLAELRRMTIGLS